MLAGNTVMREAVRVLLAMTTAAGTVYTSVRSALSDHESRIGFLEARQTAAEQHAVSREEIEAHWGAIAGQLDRIETDIRDIRYQQTRDNELNGPSRASGSSERR